MQLQQRGQNPATTMPVNSPPLPAVTGLLRFLVLALYKRQITIAIVCCGPYVCRMQHPHQYTLILSRIGYSTRPLQSQHTDSCTGSSSVLPASLTAQRQQQRQYMVTLHLESLPVSIPLGQYCAPAQTGLNTHRHRDEAHQTASNTIWCRICRCGRF